jgi:CRISPR-associated protein Cas2
MTLVLVVYDIPDNKRRTKLSHFLERHGRRVQKWMQRDEMLKLHQKVLNRVKPKEDNVRFYWLTSEAVPQVLSIGSEKPTAPPNHYIL